MRQVFQEARQAAATSATGADSAGAPSIPLHTLDLSTIPLDQDAVDPLADMLSVDFGLDKLVLENCMITDEGLKAFLHALLISGTLPNLSLASNKKIKLQGWNQQVALGEIVSALERAPKELVSPAGERRRKKEAKQLNEDGGGMEGPELRKVDDAEEEEEPELQPFAGRDSAHACRVSPALVRRFLQRVCILTYRTHGTLQPTLLPPSGKLQRNTISNAGAAAIALVLKDYPDMISFSGTLGDESGFGLGVEGSGARSGSGSRMEGGTSGGVPMRPSFAVRSGSLPLSASEHVNQGISTTKGGTATVRKDPRRTSYLLSPTDSAASSNVSSSDATSVSGGGGGGSGGQMTTVLSPVLAAVPDIVSSPQGGVTSKRMNLAAFGG
ncbi:hypothetical protein CF326_g9627, partial [Tilletia indica]